MKWTSSALCVFFLSQCMPVSANETAALNTPDFGVISWVNNIPNGFYSPKQEFRYEDPSDNSSVLGVFANEFIAKGELLVRVPWNGVVRGPPTSDEEMDQMDCNMIQFLAGQMRLGNSSFYGPYVEYLNSMPRGLMPSDWSEEGKKLLLDIVNLEDAPHAEQVEIPPKRLTSWKHRWVEQCGGKADDEVGWRAAMMALLRADDDIMIPGYDFYNHRNGGWNNVEAETVYQMSHETYAIKDIQPGEQIYLSYNQCLQCGGRILGYGTAEMFRDYGFVEVYPQRWHYLDEKVLFDIDEGEDGNHTLTWVQSKPVDSLAVQAKRFFYDHLLRLERLWVLDYEQGNTTLREKIPPREWDMAWHFYSAMVTGMRLAYESLDESDDSSLTTMYEKPEPSVIDLEYEQQLCDLEAFEEYDGVVTMSLSAFEVLEVSKDDETGDICFHEEDGVFFMCSSFASSYYEFLVHPAASFLPKVESVLIVSNLAPLVLHEVMKYKSIKSIVVIQDEFIVTRAAQEYFDADPYFDDDRVENWFGDPKEILTLMQELHDPAFDLVVVDIGKHTSRGLWEDDRFAGFVKPGGLFVMSNLLMEDTKQKFAYSARLLHDSPRHCERVRVLASPTIDLLRAPLHDHKVETRMFRQGVMTDDRLKILHDFIHQPNPQLSRSPQPSTYANATDLGALLTLELYNTDSAAQSTLRMIETILGELGFFVVSTTVVAPSKSYILELEEGFIMTRFQPETKYLGLEIHLFERIELLSALEKSIENSLPESLASAARFVTSGTYKAPSINNTCGLSESTGVQIASDSLLPEAESTILAQAIRFLWKEKHVRALIVCEDDGCELTSSMEKEGNVKEVLRLSMECPIQATAPSDKLAEFLRCEDSVGARLKELLGSGGPVDVLVVDGGLSAVSLKRLGAVIDRFEEEADVVNTENLLLMMPASSSNETGRNAFAQRYHQSQSLELENKRTGWALGNSVRAKYLLQSLDPTSNVGYELTMVAQGVPECGSKLRAFDPLVDSYSISVEELRGDWLRHSPRIVPKNPQTSFGLGAKTVSREEVGMLVRAEFECKLKSISPYIEKTLLSLGASRPTRLKTNSTQNLVVTFDSGYVLATDYMSEYAEIFLFVENDIISPFRVMEKLAVPPPVDV
eukprot:Nitzschia sp. Nitz4//scaffold98_size77359//48279//52296//NITZ4_005551-RA/size77359-processed-gene-0.18-mRNA-1//1//CDS//3329560766//1776//frame0